MCVLSQQNFNRDTQFVVLKNLSEDVIILSMPNADDAGIVAVFLFECMYVGDEIYIYILYRVSNDTLLFAAAHCAFTSAAAV
jgi:hypothetical protein